MIRTPHRKWMGVLIAVLALGAAACDNPVGRGGTHPAGIRVVSEADVQVASFRLGGSVLGEVSAAIGSPATFTLVAVDRNDNVLPIDGHEIWVSVIVDGGVATAAVQDLNRLVVTPVQAGTGRLDLTVMHIDHPEFTARIPLTVTALGVPD